MAIKKNTKTTLLDIEVNRKGFSTLKLHRTESGKIRLAAQKKGVDAYILTNSEAEDLADALNEMVASK